MAKRDDRDVLEKRSVLITITDENPRDKDEFSMLDATTHAVKVLQQTFYTATHPHV